jgi:long-chain acyl-CoA synthetase
MRHKFDPAEALAIIDGRRVTNTHLVPTQFVRLLRLPDDVKAGFTGESLRIVWHGAAPCPPEVKRRMIEWWGPKITEYYGATEGGVVSLCSSEEWLARPGTVGRPLPTCEVTIRDEQGAEVPTGTPGTIWIRSRTGQDFEYHNDPAKTAGAHLEPGVFTMGDVGFLDADGYLYLSDRKIDMIISGGVNIYPAEIEGVLAAHPAVRDAAVFGVPDEEFGEAVKAVVELHDGVADDEALRTELARHCRAHLAGYKVPRSFDVVDALPRHPTGKLYKRLLRDPYWAATGRAI